MERLLFVCSHYKGRRAERRARSAAFRCLNPRVRHGRVPDVRTRPAVPAWRRAQREGAVKIAASERRLAMNEPSSRPPFPPFTSESATQKVRLAEDAWNSREPERVALAYSVDSVWRNRSEFLTGREEIVRFLHRKWAKELDYRLIKELWAFHESR